MAVRTLMFMVVRRAVRLVGLARTECLDWILACNRHHLERVLTEYVNHYNTARPHRGIGLRTPAAATHPPPEAIKQLHGVERSDVLGGLIHESAQREVCEVAPHTL